MALMTPIAMLSNSDLADMLGAVEEYVWLSDSVEKLLSEAAHRLRLCGVSRDAPDRVGSLDARLRAVESVVGDLVAAEASRKAREANRG